MIRRHRPFLVLLVLGVLLRVVVMVGYRPAIFYVDSLASYLLPLPTLDPSGQDPIGYDLFLLGPVVKVASRMCSKTRHRSTWRRNWCPKPAPSEAPSIRPGISAITKLRSSLRDTTPRFGVRVVNG